MKLKSILLVSASVLMAGTSFAQTHVSTGTQKYTLLEEGTGTWCGYCPDGAQRIEETIEPSFPKAICVSFHNGDPMELSGDPFNNAFITGFPGATVDRLVWTHGSTTSQNVNRGYWSTDVGVQDATTAKFQIDLLGLYDSATRKITLKVTAKTLAALTGSYRINAYVVVDSIAATGSNVQHSYMYATSGSWYFNQCQSPCTSSCSSCANLPDSIYSHMNVVTDVLAASGSIWGDTVNAFTNPASGVSASKTYIYTIPATTPSKYVKVVGIVQKYGTTTTDRAIQNAARARVRYMWKSVAGVGNLGNTVEGVEIYPNPANSNINVSTTLTTPSDVKITIFNTIGQVVAQNVYPANGTMFSESISLAQVPNGMYLMNFEVNGEKITKKFVVSK